MGYLLASATISFLIAFFFVRCSGNGMTWGNDSDFGGPQKFHDMPVSRLGGGGVLAALIACALFVRWNVRAEPEKLILVACALPAAGAPGRADFQP
jgi:UDP-N-acetylmuramyl pentapeptide phosphotransferase/UDP-N-acetylglucosamine-1-phosphate transferase